MMGDGKSNKMAKTPLKGCLASLTIREMHAMQVWDEAGHPWAILRSYPGWEPASGHLNYASLRKESTIWFEILDMQWFMPFFSTKL